MSTLDPIISQIKSGNYSDKKQLTQYLLYGIKNGKIRLTQDDKTAVLECVYGEVNALLSGIPSAESYKVKDSLFDFEDVLLGLVMQICSSPDEIPEHILASINLLVETVDKERYVENAIDVLFKQDRIDKDDVVGLLSMVYECNDEYQKGRLYVGLIHYVREGGLSKLTEDAKTALSNYIASEMKRYISSDDLCDEIKDNLELIADVCKHFPSDAVINLLYELLKLGNNRINYFAVESLLVLSQRIPSEIIDALANDLLYADSTHNLLERHGKADLFPQELRDPVYLAKSDMVQWLAYPTELGKAPDKIEYIGKIKYLFKKEVFHVFKYCSDSDNLEDELKNQWLIGWSSNEGGTFSNFDKYSLFEKDTTEKTLKNIKKKLIG